MEEVIKEFLKTSPGLSAKRILTIYKNQKDQNIMTGTIYKHLRKLKRKGILINKGDRWYINAKYKTNV